MSEVKSLVVLQTPRGPGEIRFASNRPDNKYNSIIFCCPCGCGDLGRLELRIEGEEVVHPSWSWDGNKEEPTLSPSILTTVGCKYHGHLVKGIWISC